jgi:hypothetical protein
MSDQSREVLQVIKPQTVMEGAGVRLKRSIATASLDNLDPFLRRITSKAFPCIPTAALKPSRT